MDDSLIIDIIRRLQWPSGNANMKLACEDLRRPTAYWLYQAISSNQKTPTIEKVSSKTPSRNSVFQHYQKVVGTYLNIAITYTNTTNSKTSSFTISPLEEYGAIGGMIAAIGGIAGMIIKKRR